VLAGEVAHGDSLGNKGRMTAGDVQWMTAGSGILHQEMPKGDAQGRMHGFQLWANLPAAHKMTDPRYQDIPAATIPEVTEDDGTRAASSVASSGQAGPVEGIATDSSVAARYVDISVPPFKRKRIQVETTRNAFAYVFAGAGTFRDASDPQAVLTESGADPNAQPVYDAKNHSLVLFDRGDEIVVQAGPEAFVSCWFPAAARRAGRVVRPDCDEHSGSTPPGHDRATKRQVHPSQVTRFAAARINLSLAAANESPVAASQR